MAEGLNQPNNNPQMAGLYEKHAALIEMFPDLNFAAVFTDYGHMSSDALATFILEHIDEMPKIQKAPKVQPQQQKRGTKRKSTTGDGGESDSDENYHSDDEYKGDRLIDKMFAEMVQTVKDQLQDESQRIGLGEILEVRRFLEKKFTLVRAEFITMAFRAFDGHFVATCFACFFSQNSYIEYVKQLTQRLSDGFYVRNERPMVNARHPKNVDFSTYSKSITGGYARYCALLEEYQRNYPQLLESEIQLRANASTVRYHKDEEGLMECLVCFDQVHFSRMISCQVSELTGMEEWKFDTDQPTSSATLNRRSVFQLPMGSSDKNGQGSSSSKAALVSGPSKAAGVSSNTVQPTTKEKDDSIEILPTPMDEDIQIVFEQYSPIKLPGIKVDKADHEEQDISSSDSIENIEEKTVPKTDDTKKPEEDGSKDILLLEEGKSKTDEQQEQPQKSLASAQSPTTEEVHSFCRDCIRGQAQAATTDAPLAPGGLGLKCMVSGCTHILRYADIRTIIPRDVRTKLEERIVEENIGIAHIINLERCRKCNFAMEMDVPAEVNKVFDCFNCKARICRLCERDWDEDHFGMSCEDLDKKMNHDRKLRDMERRMNEAIVRKCPRCGLNFVKESGCNKMTCRCGMKMCYLCRTTNIDYTHFCQHMRDPTKKINKCDQCTKPCLLYEDYRKNDAKELEKIRMEGDLPTSSGAAAASSSKPTPPKKGRLVHVAPRRRLFDDDGLRARIHAQNDMQRQLNLLRAAGHELQHAFERFERRGFNNPVGLPAANNPIAAPDPPAAAANHDNNGPRDPLIHRRELVHHHHRRPAHRVPVIPWGGFQQQGNAQNHNAPPQLAPRQDAPRDPRQIHHRHLLLPHPPRNILFDNVPPVPRPYQFGGGGPIVNVNNGLLVTPNPNPNNNNNNNLVQRQQRFGINIDFGAAVPVQGGDEANAFRVARGNNNDVGGGGGDGGPNPQENAIDPAPGIEVHIRTPAYPPAFAAINPYVAPRPVMPPAVQKPVITKQQHNQPAVGVGNPQNPTRNDTLLPYVRRNQARTHRLIDISSSSDDDSDVANNLLRGNRQNPAQNADANAIERAAVGVEHRTKVRSAERVARIKERRNELLNEIGREATNQLNEVLGRRDDVLAPYAGRNQARTHRLIDISSSDDDSDVAANLLRGNRQKPAQNANANAIGHHVVAVGGHSRARFAERAERIKQKRNELLNEIDREATNRLNEVRRNDTLLPYAGRNRERIQRLIDISSSDTDAADNPSKGKHQKYKRIVISETSSDDADNPLRPGTSRGRKYKRIIDFDTSSSDGEVFDDDLRHFAPGSSNNSHQKKRRQRTKK